MSTTPAIAPNPFPGLRPFREDEEYLFFGRESQVNAMVDELGAQRFLAVVGPSGSGKSSLVNCGLQPGLRRGLMPRAGTTWRVAQFRPGNDPMGALARALAQNGVLFTDYDSGSIPLEKIIETTLRMSTRGLLNVFQEARLEPHVNLLIVVDQFEELFRYATLESSQNGHEFRVTTEATAFVNLLLEASKQTAYPVYVAVTMRSDFLGDCARFAGLPEAINQGLYLVSRLTRDERKSAIGGPVAIGGALMKPVLLTRLVNDVGDNPDQLSILQHALNRTWAYWQDDDGEGPIDLPHYEAIGTMARALDQHAEQAYAELGSDRKKYICEKIFKALTDKGTDVRGTRRPTRLATLCALAAASQDEVVEVIEVFRKPSRSFLMPPAPEPLDAETVIDISHESLMRVWQRLRQWTNEEAESARMYRRLAEAAVLHQAGKAGLWGDPELQLALDWRDENQPNERWAQRYHPEFALAMNFLDKSEAGKRRARLRFMGLIGLILLGAVLAFYFIGTTQVAQEQLALTKAARDSLARAVVRADSASREAQRYAEIAGDSARSAQLQRAIAQDSAIVAQAQRAIARDSALAAQLQRDRARTAEQAALDSATVAQAQRDSARIARQAALDSATVAQQERQEAMAARLETVGLDLAVEAVRQGQLGNAALGALLAREAFLFNQSSGGASLDQVYDALRQNLNALNAGRGGPRLLDSHADWVRAVAYSSNGWIASAGNERDVYVWSPGASTPRRLSGHDGMIRAVAFNGTLLVSGSDDRTLKVWQNVNSNQPPTTLGPFTGPVRAVALSPNGQYLAAASDGSPIRVWQVANLDAPPVTLTGHDGAVHALAFHPNSALLASAGAGTTVRVWDRASGAQQRMLQGHNGPVQAVAFSPTGAYLASGGRDAVVRLWDMAAPSAAPTLLRGHNGLINALAFSPDGQRLASGSADATVRVWAVGRTDNRPVILQEHAASVRGVAFSADGSRLVSGSVDRTLRVWNINIDQLAQDVCSALPPGRALTEQEWIDNIGTDISYDQYVPCSTGSN